MDAAYHRHTEIVQLLLSNDADSALKTNDSKTPLMLAEKKGHVAIIDLLKRK